MAESLRAVYRNGQIKLLEPAELEEGQELVITFRSEPSRQSRKTIRQPARAAQHHVRVRKALDGMLSNDSLVLDDSARLLDDEDAERLLDELHRETAGAEPLSSAVIEDRERP